MNQNIEILKKSPVFHMSLHSKELFHSNFLEWLAADPELRPVFKNVMEAIGVSRDYINSWGDDFEVLREKMHFDLVVKAPDTMILKTSKDGNEKLVSKDDGKLYLVIENKIKSIPTKKQLEEYSNNIDKLEENNRLASGFMKILLSIESLEGVCPDTWKEATYSQVIEALEKPLPDSVPEYKKEIIKDYTQMLKALINVLSSINVGLDTSFLANAAENELKLELDQLRIDDLYDKWRTAKIAHLLTKEINKDEELKSLNLRCGSGYTNKTPLIDCFVDFEDNDMVSEGGIQIQGRQYRHCIHTDKTQTPKCELAKKYNGFLYKTKETFNECVLEECNAVVRMSNKDKEELFEASKMRNDFCVYDEKKKAPFWYQYVTIGPKTTIGQIAECMKKDMATVAKFRVPKK